MAEPECSHIRDQAHPKRQNNWPVGPSLFRISGALQGWPSFVSLCVVLPTSHAAQYPRNYAHVGRFCSSRFTSNGKVQCQCRKSWALCVARRKVMCGDEQACLPQNTLLENLIAVCPMWRINGQKWDIIFISVFSLVYKHQKIKMGGFCCLRMSCLYPVRAFCIFWQPLYVLLHAWKGRGWQGVFSWPLDGSKSYTPVL